MSIWSGSFFYLYFKFSKVYDLGVSYMRDHWESGKDLEHEYHYYHNTFSDLYWFYIWNKVSKNEPSKICRRHPLKNLKGYGMLQADHSLSNFLNVFHKFYLVHSWILFPYGKVCGKFLRNTEVFHFSHDNKHDNFYYSCKDCVKLLSLSWQVFE